MVCVMVLHFICEKDIIPNAFTCKAGEKKGRSLVKQFVKNEVVFSRLFDVLFHVSDSNAYTII